MAGLKRMIEATRGSFVVNFSPLTILLSDSVDFIAEPRAEPSPGANGELRARGRLAVPKPFFWGNLLRELKALI